MAEVPVRLLRQDRPPNPDFPPSERLFRRIHPGHFTEGQVLPAAIPFPEFSVNREAYSLPADVLLNHPGFGIFAFRVNDVPRRLESSDNRVFTFAVEHDPLEENYAHSVVRSYSDGVRAEKEPPKTVRTQFRLLLCSAGMVLSAPDTGLA
jgi:hypothetical protein